MFFEGVNDSATTASNMPVKSVESKSAETSSLVFTPNVIIHISSNCPLVRSELKVNHRIKQYIHSFWGFTTMHPMMDEDRPLVVHAVFPAVL